MHHGHAAVGRRRACTHTAPPTTASLPIHHTHYSTPSPTTRPEGKDEHSPMRTALLPGAWVCSQSVRCCSCVPATSTTTPSSSENKARQPAHMGPGRQGIRELRCNESYSGARPSFYGSTRHWHPLCYGGLLTVAVNLCEIESCPSIPCHGHFQHLQRHTDDMRLPTDSYQAAASPSPDVFTSLRVLLTVVRSPPALTSCPASTRPRLTKSCTPTTHDAGLSDAARESSHCSSNQEEVFCAD